MNAGSSSVRAVVLESCDLFAVVPVLSVSLLALQYCFLSCFQLCVMDVYISMWLWLVVIDYLLYAFGTSRVGTSTSDARSFFCGERGYCNSRQRNLTARALRKRVTVE